MDVRAHQVFQGFADLAVVSDAVKRRYPPGSLVHILTCTETKEIDVAGLDEVVWTASSVLVVPSLPQDHPGGFYGLVWVVDRLLGPGGCPWDQEQTHHSLKRHLIEEAYELIEAIDLNDDRKLQEELGDVLLQPVMHAQMERKLDSWDIDAVSDGITEKLVRRHPHVFGGKTVRDSDEVLQNWDAIKAQEGESRPTSVLAGVPRSLPALLRAHEVSKRAARQGFEWPDLDGVWDKLDEEGRELREAIQTGVGIEEEIGDLLFTVVNLSRWLKIEPEEALRGMVDRFTRRFVAMESMADRPLAELSPELWEEIWKRAKAETTSDQV